MRGTLNIDLLLSNVHTTPLGAIHYADTIANQLKQIIDHDVEAKGLNDLQTKIQYKVIKAAPEDRVNKRSFHIDLPDQFADTNIRILQKQRVGPFSPVLEISGGGKTYFHSVWDQFCHFERDSYVPLFSGLLQTSGEIVVNVSEREPDYQKCRREGTVWPGPDQRFLRSLSDVFVFSDAELEAR